eukprot:NODE_7_length_67686_cov_1.621421.p1 type:complete len:1119 gc:universal NODE_7_length_67686_cov_1.621421:9929-6573(-)
MFLKHFISSTVFEVFFLLGKDNEIIDKLTALGHVTDIAQNLSYIFYNTIPWQNVIMQEIFMYMNLNITSPYLYVIAVVFVLLFLASFATLCYQIQNRGSVSASKLLEATRYQYGLLSTFLFFPSIDQLLNYMTFGSDVSSILLTTISLVLFVIYSTVVLLGSFLLFSSEQNPSSHISRNSQRQDLLENVVKIIISISFTYCSPIFGVLSLIICWGTLYIVSMLIPPFYNYNSNRTRSGVLFGLLCCSFGSLMACVYKLDSYIWSVLTLISFFPLSFIGMLVFKAVEERRRLPTILYIHALEFIDNPNAIKCRRLIRDSLEEIMSSFWNPAQIVALSRNLCNVPISKNLNMFVSNIVYHNNNDDNDDESVSVAAQRRELYKSELGSRLTKNMANITRILVLQLYESGIRKFRQSSWLRAQYILFLECGNDIYPKLIHYSHLKSFGEELLNNTFLMEKQLDVHYILYSCYKKRIFEKAKENYHGLKNVVDVVAFTHDKEMFIDTLSELIWTCRTFTEFLQSSQLNVDNLLSLTTRIQKKWTIAKYYLKKALSRVPTSPFLLRIYKISCLIFDNNEELHGYISGVLQPDGSVYNNESIIEKQKNSLFETHSNLPPVIDRYYKTIRLFIRAQALLLLGVFTAYFAILVFQSSLKIDYYRVLMDQVLDYGINSDKYFTGIEGLALFQDTKFFNLIEDISSNIIILWDQMATNTDFQQMKPNPFDQIVSFVSQNTTSNITFEKSNFNLQFQITQYLRNSNVADDSNFANIQSNFYAFFLNVLSNLKENEFGVYNVMNITSLSLFFFILIGGMPICYYLYRKIKKDISKECLEFVYTSNVTKFELDLTELQNMAKFKERVDISKAFSFASKLKFRFIIYLSLYFSSSCVAFYIQEDSAIFFEKFIDSMVFLKARNYYDIAVSAASYELKVRPGNTSLSTLGTLAEIHHTVAQFVNKATSPTDDGKLMPGSPTEFWDRPTTKKYYGNGCIDSSVCGSPVLGHRLVMMNARFLKVVKDPSWQNLMLQIQLEMAESEEHLLAQSNFLSLILNSYKSENQFRNTRAAVVLFLNVLICIFVIFDTRIIIYELRDTHNRIKILKSIFVIPPNDFTIQFSNRMLSQMTDDSE